LAKQVQAMKDKLTEYERTTPSQMWLQELDEFAEAYKKDLAHYLTSMEHHVPEKKKK
jgi:hypothetical protein